MHISRRSRVVLAIASAATVSQIGLLAIPSAQASGKTSRSSERKLTDAANGIFDVLEHANQYAQARRRTDRAWS